MPSKPRLRLSLLLPFLLSAFALTVPIVSHAAPPRHRRHSHSVETQALVRAVLVQDELAAIRLLNRGADPNAAVTKAATLPPSDFTQGPLLTNALRGSEQKTALALIAHGAKVNVRDSIGSTPLSLAVVYGMRPVVAALLTHGANVNAHDSEDETALFGGISGSSQNLEIVHLLVAHGANVNVQESGFHQTVLMRAASNNVFADTALFNVLLNAHPNLELRDMKGDTALRLAEKQGNTSIVTLLRAAGAKEHSLFPLIVAAEAAYTITDLGPGCANAINSHGDVAGIVSDGSRNFNGQILGQAFLWSKGVKQTWKGFGGPSSVANDINDQGQVVGSADFAKEDSGTDYLPHAFFWQNGVMQDLHPHTGWVTKNAAFPSSAVSINNSSQVALAVNSDTFLWSRIAWQDLETNGVNQQGSWDTATPTALNNKGQVILYLQASGNECGGIWENGKMRRLMPPKSEEYVIEGQKHSQISNTYAESLNDAGEITGHTDGDEPVLWTNGKISPLPRLYQYNKFQFGMHAEHINNRSQIVGTVSDSLYVPFPEQHAVLWSGGKVMDLNALVAANSGWVLEDARSINDAGQIVGRGAYRGKEHAFLLTPLTGSKRVY